jgi:perosamine synthetase
MIPYGRQTIEEDDIDAVVGVLRENNFLTTGPKVVEFEKSVCEYVGCKAAVAVNSGTAALHAAMFAIGIEPGDEVIVPAISFAATSNCVIYQKGKAVFCDVDRDTLCIDVTKISALITSKTKAIIAVDYAGQKADYKSLQDICKFYRIHLIADAAHSFGLNEVGLLADLTTFSFHPVKNITTGEGGMIVTNNMEFAKRMRRFRSHGIDVEYQNRKLYEYDMVDLGYNYRLTDIQCALGLSQLKKIGKWIEQRQELAHRYDMAFIKADIFKYFSPLMNHEENCYHLYMIVLNLEKIGQTRDEVFTRLKGLGIGVNVHYKPIYMHSYYQNQSEYKMVKCPVAEDMYSRIITLPIFPTLTFQQQDKVIDSVLQAVFVTKQTGE